ncbi:MAG: hypothetical protein IJW65_01740, partial [Clostridia bacterium]|nr:hypothetical protein [Clostridia bacterium]
DYDDGVITTDPTCTEKGVKTFTCQNDNSHTYTEEVDAAGHTLTQVEAKAPDCVNVGWGAYEYCSVCDYTTKQEIAALGHSYSAVVTNPTCEADGYTTHTCSKCDDTYTDTPTNKLGHDWDEGTQTIDPTCEGEGVMTYICQNDESHTKTEPISATGHNWDEGVVTKDCTCTEDGVKTYTCQNDASHTKTEAIDAKGHTPSDTVVENKVFNCKTGGSYDSVVYCSVCTAEISRTYVELAATGNHSMTSEITTAPTCTDNGVQTYYCTNTDCTHSYTRVVSATGHKESAAVIENSIAATCTTAGSYDSVIYCSVCNTEMKREAKTVEIDTTAHTGEANVIKNKSDATCTDKGYTGDIHWSCCDALNTKGEEIAINPNAHTTDETYVDGYVAPTCTTAGATGDTKYSCCDAIKVASTVIAIDPDAHTTDETYVDGYVAPTCTEKGATGDTKYLCCDAIKVESTEIAANGHTLTQVGAKAPTCTEIGWNAYEKCSVCSYTTYVEIPATDHNYTSEVTTQPTCTEKGVKTYTCQNDASHTYTEDIAATGHTLTQVGAKAPTCTEIGWDAYETCSVCDYTTYAEKAALNHNYEAVVTPPTCTADGYTTHTCTRCNDIYTDTPVDATGHAETKEYKVIDGVLYHVATCGCEETREAVEAGTVVEVANQADLQTVVLAGYSVKIMTNIDLTAAIEIYGDVNVTIDMNGKTLTADWESDGVVEVLFIHDGATVTVTGNGTMISGDQAETNSVISCIDNSTLTIENGYFYSASCGDVIYARTNSTVYIKGGKFECAEDYYGTWYVLDVLESEDEAIRGKFVVTGGEFVKFNPANHTCDGDYKNKVADGYHSIYDAETSSYTVSVHVAADAVVENNVNPTCTADGSYDTVVYCSGCGAELSRGTTTVDKLGHTEAEAVVENDVKPTCTVDGSYDNVVYCTVCGAELSRTTVTVDALGHTEVIDEAVAADCENTGLTEGKHCDVCGEVLVAQEVVAATGHAWTNEYDTTCDNGCGETRVVDIHTDAIGVNGDSYTATTIVNGNTVTIKANGTVKWLEGTGAGYSNWIGFKITAPEGVDPADVTITRPDGAIRILANILDGVNYAHMYYGVKAATTYEYKVDWNSDGINEITVVIDATDVCLASAAVIENKSDATCTEDGTYDSVVYCSVCGKELSRETIVSDEATGHTEVVDEAVAADCENTGLTEGKHCDVCGEILVKQTVVDALGHTEVVDAAVAADCENTGLTEGKHCSVCNKVLVPQDVTEALGHEYDDEYDLECNRCEHTRECPHEYDNNCDADCNLCGEERTPADHVEETLTGTPASCNKVGLTDGVKCSECGKILVEQTSIPALRHNYVTSTVEATCTTGGYTLNKCENCSASYKTNRVSAKGHDYESKEISASCTTGSYTLYTCKNCESSYKENYVSAGGHKYTPTVTDPTCTTRGYTTYTCKCGIFYTDDYVPATGHTYTVTTVEASCSTRGYELHDCDNCDMSYKTNYTNASGHVYVATVTKATCTTRGYTTYTCSCGMSYKADFVAASGHTYVPEDLGDGTTKYTCECGKFYVVANP